MTRNRDNKAVIFDLDGVLVNTGPFHRQSWFDLAGKEGLKMSDELFSRTFGMQNYQILPLLAGCDLSADQIKRMSDWKEKRYRELIAERLTLAEGAETLINELQTNGFLLAIGSSAPRENIDFICRRIPLLGSLNAYVAGEDVSRGKPAPDTFLKAAKELSIAPNRCVVVEDAVQGIQAAKAAAMHAVALTTTRSREELLEADLIVDSLAELKADDFFALLTQVFP
jgi:beta-phosphoglucomutase family hydrolase